MNVDEWIFIGFLCLASSLWKLTSMSRFWIQFIVIVNRFIRLNGLKSEQNINFLKALKSKTTRRFFSKKYFYLVLLR